MENDRISARGINPEILEEFRKVVKNKYGKLNTVYGLEIQKALEMYISASKIPQGSAHTHERKATNIKVTLEKQTRLKSNLAGFETVKETFFNNTADTESFQKYYAERLIKDTLQVYDPRTIEKYCSELKTGWELNRIG
jgi:hypothetical protein